MAVKKKITKKKVTKKKPKKVELTNKCVECGKPCRVMYCSNLCKQHAFQKTSKFLKNKCKVCEKPCSNIFCSNKCKGIDKIKEPYIAVCETCGTEFTYKIPAYKRRGQMRFCSTKCQTKIFSVDDNFFKGSEDISKIYQTLGFIFANAVIFDIKIGVFDIIAEETKLRKFASTIKSTYRIQKTDGKDMFRSYIKSYEIVNYLFDIGFTNTHETHTFPIILPEYKLDFIKGFSETNSELHQEGKVMFIKTKSYSLARGISEFLNCELITKQLSYVCIIREENTIKQLQINN